MKCIAGNFVQHYVAMCSLVEDLPQQLHVNCTGCDDNMLCYVETEKSLTKTAKLAEKDIGVCLLCTHKIMGSLDDVHEYHPQPKITCHADIPADTWVKISKGGALSRLNDASDFPAYYRPCRFENLINTRTDKDAKEVLLVGTFRGKYYITQKPFDTFSCVKGVNSNLLRLESNNFLLTMGFTEEERKRFSACVEYEDY